MSTPQSTRHPACLEDLLVLDLTGPPGQLMGKVLADMGARVVKVEPPGGDPARRIGPFAGGEPHPDRSLFFWSYNTSKQSITLNLEHPQGRELLLQLAGRADVLLETFPHGYMDSLGLGYSHLRDRNPSLIYTALTPFGAWGPWRDYQASDLVLMALGGVMASCGYDDVPGAPPIRPARYHAWHTACHWGLIGTLSALYHRDLTGQGQFVDASAHEAVSTVTEQAIPFYLYLGKVAQRNTGRHHSLHPSPKTQCPTRDGRLVNVFGIPRSPQSWEALLEWMGRYLPVDDLREERYLQSFLQGAHEGPEAFTIMDRVRQFISMLTAEEVFHGAQQRRFPWGVVRRPEENLEDPHLWERGFFNPVEHPEMGRSFIYPGRPFVLTATPWRVRRRAPLLGEDNLAVYCGLLGLTPAEVATLREAGVV